MGQGRLVQQIALLTFSAWISHHAGGAPNQRDRLMPRSLQVQQKQDGLQAADVEAVSSWVKSDIAGGHFPVQLVAGAGGDILDHSSPL